MFTVKTNRITIKAPHRGTGIAETLKDVLPPEYLESRWYAACTRSRHEKRIVEQLQQREIETFLPLYESVRRWKDRRVRLQLPLFPGYVFVRIALASRLRVLQVPSVVRFVSFNGLPTPLPDGEIETLQRGLKDQKSVEPHPYLTVGRQVRIKNGPLAGAEGILIRKKNAVRVVLSLDLIQRSASVEIDASDIERIL